jgi:Tol biopolymer transport system component
MKANRRIFLLLAFYVLVICKAMLFAQDQAGKVFEKALFLEESEGDLQKAIVLYEKIVKEHGKDLEMAAKAQLHIGFCFEKQGKSEAVKAYELVVERYSGQKEQVAAAQARLLELKGEMPKNLSIVKLSGWDKPGIFIEPFEIFPDRSMMIGVEFMKGQNIVVCDLKTNQVSYITNHLWSLKGYCYTYNPVLSPNGKEIAFLSSSVDIAEPAGNNLIVSTLDGRSRILAADEKEAYIPNGWLADGSAVLAIKVSPDNAAQLGLVPREGGNFRGLVSLQEKNIEAGRNYSIASVSPDGRYILFTDTAPGEKSDIYIIKSEGGTPKYFIKHPADDKYPRWSPDGQYVVFLSLRHGSWALWGVSVKNGEAAGEPFLIQGGMEGSFLLNWTTGGLASWNTFQINDIFIMDMDPATGEPAGAPRQLEYTATGGNVSPAWSPDGEFLAFIKRNPNGVGASIVVAGSGIREFPVPVGYGTTAPRWTPDGSGIGMLSGNKEGKWFFNRLSLDSGKWKTTPIPAGISTRFDWSGNGNAIFLASTGYVEKGAGIIELDLETGDERFIYHPEQETGFIIFRWLKVSHDHKQLAFLILNANLAIELIVANLETGETHSLATDVGYTSWSPDGRKLLSDRALSGEGPKQSLFIRPESGGTAKEIDLSEKLPLRSEILTPDWSPDGKKIVFCLRSTQSEVSLFQNIIPGEK